MSDAGDLSTELEQLEETILEVLSSKQRETYNELDQDQKKIFLEAIDITRIKELGNEPSRIRRFLESTTGSIAGSLIIAVLTGGTYWG